MGGWRSFKKKVSSNLGGVPIIGGEAQRQFDEMTNKPLGYALGGIFGGHAVNNLINPEGPPDTQQAQDEKEWQARKAASDAQTAEELAMIRRKGRASTILSLNNDTPANATLGQTLLGKV